MLFRQLFDQASSTYTYLIADQAIKEAVLVDPVLEQVERDLELIRELGLTLRYCMETHIHADHITGTAKLREITSCSSIVPAGAQVSCANWQIKDEELLQLGNVTITAISTPGHTDSHMAYLINDDRVLTGDALFIRGCGRTDFQDGDAGMLYDSVTSRLFTLPEQTWVYPGHDYQGNTVSTIGEEVRWNPRFRGRDGRERSLSLGQKSVEDDRQHFIEFMSNLHLPNPKKMMEAVPANQQCGKKSF